MLEGPFEGRRGGFAYAAYANVLITSQHGEVTVDDLDDVAVLSERLHRAYPGDVLVCAHVDKLLIPSAEVRAAVARDMKRFNDGTRRWAIVLGDDGFAASIVRSILSSIHTLTRQQVEERYVMQVTDAVSYLSPAMRPGRGDAAGVTRAIEATIRAAADSAPH